jgi:hypothetical protein
MKQRAMVFAVDNQREKTLANLQRFVAELVPAKRAECLSKTLGKVEDRQRHFWEISTSAVAVTKT